MDLPPLGDVAVVVAGALVAGFASGLSGTGYVLVALGFWLHAMPPATAAPLAALCAVGAHVQSLPRIWRGVIWPRLWPFLVGGLIGVPIGIALLRHVSVQPLKLCIGLLLILYCAWVALVRRPPMVQGGGVLADAAVGLTGGVLGGLASLSGPVPAVWAQLRGWNMHEQRGVNQPYNMMILIGVVVAAAVAGLLDRTYFLWAAIALPTTMAGTQLGLLLYRRLDDLQFNRVILALLGLSGATLIVSAAT